MKTRHNSRRAKKGNDSWQVIYMDLMTMIMVFFVILWSINKGKDIGISETVGDETTRTIHLPGDVLFSAGKSKLALQGKKVFGQLFEDPSGQVLNFNTSSLVKRMLVIHGHTDGDGKKENNFRLGYDRAYSVYKEILKYGKDTSDHVVICTHADNTSAREVPQFTGKISPIQRQAIREAKAKNRRITIEDKLVNQYKKE